MNHQAVEPNGSLESKLMVRCLTVCLADFARIIHKGADDLMFTRFERNWQSSSDENEKKVGETVGLDESSSSAPGRCCSARRWPARCFGGIIQAHDRGRSLNPQPSTLNCLRL